MSQVQEPEMQVQLRKSFYRPYIVAEMPLEEKTAIMNKRNVLLLKVKHYIDRELNLASKNIIDNSKDDYEQVKSIDET